MSDTSFSKPAHTNGPIIKIYDLSGTGGPYAEAAAILGWDPVGLQWVKVKVDSSGNIGISGTTTIVGTDTSTVFQGTASNLNATVVGTVTNIPTGTQAISGTIAATQSTSPWVVSQGTASNLQATVAGTITAVESGTWSVTGIGTFTCTCPGTQVVSQSIGTNLHTVVDNGTITTVPSGTQSTQPLRTLDFNGSATITSTANISNFTFQACEVVLISITGSFTGQISFAGFYSNNQVGVSLPVYDITGALVSATGTITSAGSINNAYIVLAGGIGLLQANPVSWASGTGIIQLEASQAGRAFINIPSGVQTVSVTTNTSVGALVYTNIALADTGTAIKASSGVLYGYDVSCIGVSGSAGAGVVKLYNKSTIPTSTDTPIITIPLNTPANNTGRSVFGLNPPMLFSSGIGIRASQLIVTTDTTAPSGTVVVNILYA